MIRRSFFGLAVAMLVVGAPAVALANQCGGGDGGDGAGDNAPPSSPWGPPPGFGPFPGGGGWLGDAGFGPFQPMPWPGDVAMPGQSGGVFPVGPAGDGTAPRDLGPHLPGWHQALLESRAKKVKPGKYSEAQLAFARTIFTGLRRLFDPRPPETQSLQPRPPGNDEPPGGGEGPGKSWKWRPGSLFVVVNPLERWVSIPGDEDPPFDPAAAFRETADDLTANLPTDPKKRQARLDLAKELRQEARKIDREAEREKKAGAAKKKAGAAKKTVDLPTRLRRGAAALRKPENMPADPKDREAQLKMADALDKQARRIDKAIARDKARAVKSVPDKAPKPKVEFVEIEL